MRPIDSILVIDDNAETLEALASLLSALGAKSVRQAASAERALEILQNSTFSLIISDYRLEGMDGVQFLEQLRSQGNQTPVLLLSGAPDKAGVIRATCHEKVDFFGKPFQMAELMAAVERLAA
jgi:DNA-binding NtrC family response regulator